MQRVRTRGKRICRTGIENARIQNRTKTFTLLKSGSGHQRQLFSGWRHLQRQRQTVTKDTKTFFGNEFEMSHPQIPVCLGQSLIYNSVVSGWELECELAKQEHRRQTRRTTEMQCMHAPLTLCDKDHFLRAAVPTLPPTHQRCLLQQGKRLPTSRTLQFRQQSHLQTLSLQKATICTKFQTRPQSIAASAVGYKPENASMSDIRHLCIVLRGLRFAYFCMSVANFSFQHRKTGLQSFLGAPISDGDFRQRMYVAFSHKAQTVQFSVQTLPSALPDLGRHSARQGDDFHNPQSENGKQRTSTRLDGHERYHAHISLRIASLWDVYAWLCRL